MKNKNNFKILESGYEEGYEDPKKQQLKEAKRRVEEQNKPFNPMDYISTQNIILFIIIIIFIKNASKYLLGKIIIFILSFILAVYIIYKIKKCKGNFLGLSQYAIITIDQANINNINAEIGFTNRDLNAEISTYNRLSQEVEENE